MPRISRSMLQSHKMFADLDNLKFGRFHIKTILVSGVGFYCDSYDIFTAGLITPMISLVYYGGNMPTWLDGLIKVSASVGTLVGQLLFGYLGDKLGRKKTYGMELIIILLATILSVFATGNVAVWLICTRFILGVGIGGDYPASAVITSEFASKKHRGRLLASVFSMQGLGIVTAAVVTICTLAAFHGKIVEDVKYVDYVWRIIIGIGCIPALFALYARLTIPESPRFTAQVANDHKQAAIDTQRINLMNDAPIKVDSDEHLELDEVIESDPLTFQGGNHAQTFREHFSQWKYLKVLLGCSLAWLCLDIGFYGTNLNQSVVLQAINFSSKGQPPYQSLWSLAVGNLIISMLGTFPGYFVSIFFIDRWGRLPIQYMGFTMLIICFVILASAYHQLLNTSIGLFLFIFALAQFFFNFGPNVTTFVIPSEVFPTRYRSTCHGISAASGKFGAILAIYAFAPIADIGGKGQGMPVVLGIFAAIMAIGLLVTRWIPETKGKTLEQINNEM